uniref:T-cell surface glycoprotein CD3 zeta chain n=1 Tax=Callorhinchus milii TaxID=7868 RepID=V9KAZ5_CALMI
MKLKRICSVIILALEFHLTDADAMTLTDPKLCYILDGILFIYGIIITALYLKLRFTKVKNKPGDAAGSTPNVEDQYQTLRNQDKDQYSSLAFSGQDAEAGAGKRNRRRRDDSANVNDTYTKLNPKNKSEAYGELKPTQQARRGKGGNDIYQGLSSATQDTYDSLKMGPLPPPPRH